jgi:hypothetical protein
MQGCSIDFPVFRMPDSLFDRGLCIALTVILGVTAFLAWKVPPLTYDALTYHLARVAHWAQIHAVRHFATGIERQIVNQPGAEFIQLHFYLLANGDRFANLIEWGAMLCSLIGVTLIAAQLGAQPSSQWMSAVFAATLPMGLVQASSTITDYVISFWMVCVASESLLVIKRHENRSIVMLGLATGLAILTKGTALPFLIPFAFANFIGLLWPPSRQSLRSTLKAAAIVLLIVGLLNGGHFIRNYSLYQNPITTDQYATYHLNENFSPKALVSNIVRHASLHTMTPWPSVKQWVDSTILKFHVKLHQPRSDPQTTLAGQEFRILGYTTSEALTGNPWHALLILLLFPLFLFGRWPKNKPVRLYSVLIASTFILFCWIFRWQIFASRLHLPFFILFSPAIGIGLRRFFSRYGSRLVAVALILAAWPWLVNVSGRPIFESDYTSSVSVVGRTREEMIEEIYKQYIQIVDLIQAEGCKNVGLNLSGDSAEYPFWMLFGSPDSDVRIEWFVAGTPSERYKDPDFKACAVICHKCPLEWVEFQGLPLHSEWGRFRLYMR